MKWIYIPSFPGPSREGFEIGAVRRVVGPSEPFCIWRPSKKAVKKLWNRFHERPDHLLCKGVSQPHTFFVAAWPDDGKSRGGGFAVPRSPAYLQYEHAPGGGGGSGHHETDRPPDDVDVQPLFDCRSARRERSNGEIRELSGTWEPNYCNFYCRKQKGPGRLA